MAIYPQLQYPGKIEPSTPDYPYGAARNITLPGDGTGTPWEAALVNDIFGFQQALLSRAGAVPSGSPDKVGASQYLDAILKAGGAQTATFAEAESLTPVVGTAVVCQERGDAVYVTQPMGYVAQTGDVVFANALIGRLQIDGTVHVSQITTDRNQQAIQDTIARAVSESAVAISLGGHSYDFSADGFVDITGVTGLTIRGGGATIQGKTAGTVENLFYGEDCDGVIVEGIIFKGSTNHQISLRNPRNCVILRCQHYGQVGFATIMFTGDRGASGVAKNNHIVNCFNDGQGLANGGFGMESMRVSTIVNPIVTGVTINTPGYAVNLKNVCIDSHVYNFLTYGNARGLVFSDDGVGTTGTGAGCRGCTATGSARNHNEAGVSLNKTNGCRVKAYIDQENNNSGSDPDNHAGLAIQGHCINDVLAVELHNINPAQKAVNVRSSSQTIRITYYDLSSPNMLSLDATTSEVRTILDNYDSSSTLFNPRDYIADLGTSNEFTNMRRFRDNFLVLDVPGEDLFYAGMSAATSVTTFRAGGVAAFSIDTSLSAIGPATGQDNVFSSGRVDKRYTEVFAANGTINTSDERQKTELLEIESAEKACALEVKANIRKFQMRDSVEKKGADGARIHFGVGAQSVKDIFEKHGLDACRYSLFCFDEWDAVDEVRDDEGNLLQAATEAGDAYGVRYDQLSMFILGAI